MLPMAHEPVSLLIFKKRALDDIFTISPVHHHFKWTFVCRFRCIALIFSHVLPRATTTLHFAGMIAKLDEYEAVNTKLLSSCVGNGILLGIPG